MSDKTINLLLTLAAIGLVCYGIFTMVNKDDKKTKKDDKQIKFDYDKELNLIDNIVLSSNFEYNNETKLKIALSNISDKDIKKTKDSFNNVNSYSFTGYYIEASKMEKYLVDLFGKNNYKLESFYDDDYWYLYDKDDKYFYRFMNTLVTNCANNVELATNCIEITPTCDIDYSKDGEAIIVYVGCIDGAKTEYKDYDYEYSYKYSYKYNKKEKDYYINNIELIKE